MGVSIQEQETVITWSRNDKTVHIYTSDSVMMARLKKRHENNPDEYKDLVVSRSQDGDEVSVDVDIPVNLLVLRKKSPEKRELSDDERQVLRDRLSSLRNRNKGE